MDTEKLVNIYRDLERGREGGRKEEKSEREIKSGKYLTIVLKGTSKVLYSRSIKRKEPLYFLLQDLRSRVP